MGKINEKLLKLYKDMLPSYQDMVRAINQEKKLVSGKDFVGPLLMHCWEEEYSKEGNKKILFVGQETCGWRSLSKDYNINEQIKDYINFDYGNGSTKLSSPFWRIIRRINKEINGVDKKGRNILWTNVNKFGINGKGKPCLFVLEKENHYYNILIEEIKIVHPDFIILLSGPHYDGDLREKIPDVEYYQVLSNYNVHQFAEVKSKLLPENCKMYRIYHPRYIEQQKKRIPECKNMIRDLIFFMKLKTL